MNPFVVVITKHTQMSVMLSREELSTFKWENVIVKLSEEFTHLEDSIGHHRTDRT